MGIENFLTFVVTAVIFIMTPGIDTIFVLNKCMGQGRKAGLYAALGINTGILVHTLFAALGLSLIVAKSAAAFSVIKYLGATYLLYLGIVKLASKTSALTTGNISHVKHSNSKNFVTGLVTNIVNPKVALFFLSFFPQFIHPAKMDSPVPFFILGLTYALLGTGWFLLLIFFASTFRKKLVSNSSTARWFDRFSGIVFIAMGLKIAFTKR